MKLEVDNLERAKNSFLATVYDISQVTGTNFFVGCYFAIKVYTNLVNTKNI